MFQLTDTTLSKEAIAARMFRNAARFWGLNDANIDNFDPLVRLLVEACAVEVYRIDNEIAALQGIMTERLASLLIPEAHVQPRPAHAIIHAASSEGAMYATLESQFVHQKKTATIPNGPQDGSMDVFFSPTGRFKVVSADIAVIAAAGRLHQLDASQQKAASLKTLPFKSFGEQTLWLGIPTQGNTDFTNLALFFDLKAHPQVARILSTLGHAECTCNGLPVKLERGLKAELTVAGQARIEDAVEELYINKRLERHVNRLYTDHFLTIAADNPRLAAVDGSMLRYYPDEFAAALGQGELDQLKVPMLWLKLTLPPDFTQSVLEDLNVSLNCFPVVNRRLNDINYRLNRFFNIIPLLTDEQFFSVKSVSGTHVDASGNAEYVSYPFDRFDHAEKGIYTVRTGDLERFDSRNAAEYLNFLVELLRDESRAFAAFGQDFMASTIKQLNQNINLIDQKIKQNLALLHTSPSYLLINPREEGDTIFVQFWSCNGEAGNGIRSGQRVDLYEGASFRRDGLVLMTGTHGGMDRLKNTEVLTAFKSVLLSRDRIVTAADVSNFCLAYLQGKAADLKVERSVGIGAQPNQGLVPVVKVSIRPAPNTGLGVADWEQLKISLAAELAHRSAVDSNYSISIVAQ